MHCNFLINDRNASAEDVERLGETVRARVTRGVSGVMLEWEIIRLDARRTAVRRARPMSRRCTMTTLVLFATFQSYRRPDWWPVRRAQR